MAGQTDGYTIGQMDKRTDRVGTVSGGYRMLSFFIIELPIILVFSFTKFQYIFLKTLHILPQSKNKDLSRFLNLGALFCWQFSFLR